MEGMMLIAGDWHGTIMSHLFATHAYFFFGATMIRE
jgi:hypothetical protein